MRPTAPIRKVRCAFTGSAGYLRCSCYVDCCEARGSCPRDWLLILALVGRAKEAAGVYTCECYADCWCKKPGLSLFRWVFPRFHHFPVTDGGVPLDAPGSS
jgi:hypothetical protein